MANFISSLRRQTALVGQSVEAVEGRRVRIAHRWVVSFVAPSYLGFEQDGRVHQAVYRAIRSWGVSLAMPRLLADDFLASHLEAALARWTGQPAALVFPSTTHVALDVLPLLARTSGAIFVDAWAYPTSLEGIRASQRKGAQVHCFSHNDALALKAALQGAGNVPHKAVVCDGVYPEGGGAAPLMEFARLAEAFRPVFYVDDSHGVGVWGEGPRNSNSPYGSGGGGLFRAASLPPVRIVLVGTLAKALGVPIAFLAGPMALIERVQAVSGAFVHSSPPSTPNIAAALEALQLNESEGDARRRQLANLVHRFQEQLRRENIEVRSNGLFPIQTIPFRNATSALRAGRLLRKVGVWPALQFNPPDHPGGAVLRFFITTLHRASDIDLAVEALASVLRGNSGQPKM